MLGIMCEIGHFAKCTAYARVMCEMDEKIQNVLKKENLRFSNLHAYFDTYILIFVGQACLHGGKKIRFRTLPVTSIRYPKKDPRLRVHKEFKEFRNRSNKKSGT